MSLLEPVLSARTEIRFQKEHNEGTGHKALDTRGGLLAKLDSLLLPPPLWSCTHPRARTLIENVLPNFSLTSQYLNQVGNFIDLRKQLLEADF